MLRGFIKSFGPGRVELSDDPYKLALNMLSVLCNISFRLSYTRLSLKGCISNFSVLVLQDEASAMLAEAEETTEGLRQQIIFAREYLKDVKIGPEQACDALCSFQKI